VQLLSLQGRDYLQFIDQQLLQLPAAQLAAEDGARLEARIMERLAERVALDSVARTTAMFMEAVDGCKARFAGGR
jgi:hypothetical protein